jgi:hypothetical protein
MSLLKDIEEVFAHSEQRVLAAFPVSGTAQQPCLPLFSLLPWLTLTGQLRCLAGCQMHSLSSNNAW